MKICVPIKTSNIDEVKNIMQKISEDYSEKVSVIEIWIGEFFTEEIIKNTSDIYTYADNILDEIFEYRKTLPNYYQLLFTIKDIHEQGSFAGTLMDKKVISEKISSKIMDNASCDIPDYLDLDYRFDEENNFEFLQKISKNTNIHFQLILSAHFFEGTPSFPSLKNRIQLMHNRGANIVKIAAMPHEEKDVLIILRLAENCKRKEIPYIGISMGNLGKISRILTPQWGGEMMFASLSKNAASASGQMTVDELYSIAGFLKMDQ